LSDFWPALLISAGFGVKNAKWIHACIIIYLAIWAYREFFAYNARELHMILAICFNNRAYREKSVSIAQKNSGKIKIVSCVWAYREKVGASARNLFVRQV